MDANLLIPTPDVLPAPAWLMILLEQLLFLLHIIVINALLGGGLIVLYNRLFRSRTVGISALDRPIAAKLPTLFAIGINLGVAPLLFLQVTFGHLFYASSVLMAVYWILIIPLLILAYYGAYIHQKTMETNGLTGRLALAASILFVIYVGFMLVNNNSLMEQPERWGAWFAQRGGTILNWSDSAIYPRFLHFAAASLAVGGMFYATVFSLRKSDPLREEGIRFGLRVLAVATVVQMGIGFWYLLALPEPFILKFMGRDGLRTAVLALGVLAGIGAAVYAFLGKYRAALIHLLATMLFMIILRYLLRMDYLADNFALSSLVLKPQWFVFFLFVVVLLVGLYAVWHIVRAGFFKGKG
jgi:hypothetical protein